LIEDFIGTRLNLKKYAFTLEKVSKMFGSQDLGRVEGQTRIVTISFIEENSPRRHFTEWRFHRMEIWNLTEYGLNFPAKIEPSSGLVIMSFTIFSNQFLPHRLQ